jgi:5'(3')-deoxyribonucleotidase
MSKIIYVDMDEVIVDCVGNLVNAYNKMYNADITLNDITEWKLPEDMARLFKYPGFFYNLSPIPGAIDGIRWMAQHFTPIIATCCMDNKDIMYQKVDWLERYLPEFILNDRVLFTSQKTALEGFAIIDDAPHHLEDFNGFRVCVDRPWNQEALSDFRIYNQDWGQIIEIFEDVIK